MLLDDSFEFLENREIYEEVISGLILKAKEAVWIATANLKDIHIKVNGRMRPLIKILADMSNAGIDIRFIYSSAPSRRLLDELKYMKHKIKFYKCIRNHIKAIIVDDAEIFLGSANFTGAGIGAKSETKRNFELGFIFKNKIIIEKVSKLFYNIINNAFCQKCALYKICKEK